MRIMKRMRNANESRVAIGMHNELQLWLMGTKVGENVHIEGQYSGACLKNGFFLIKCVCCCVFLRNGATRKCCFVCQMAAT